MPRAPRKSLTVVDITEALAEVGVTVVEPITAPMTVEIVEAEPAPTPVAAVVVEEAPAKPAEEEGEEFPTFATRGLFRAHKALHPEFGTKVRALGLETYLKYDAAHPHPVTARTPKAPKEALPARDCVDCGGSYIPRVGHQKRCSHCSAEHAAAWGQKIADRAKRRAEAAAK